MSARAPLRATLLTLALPSALALAIPIAATLLVGCDKRGTQQPEADPIDELARSLLEALAAGDRERASALGTPALAADLDERNVAVIARTLSWLGPVLAVDKQGEEAVVGGSKRSYKASFDRGYLDVEVTVVGDKIEGFAFDEGAWQGYVDQALEAQGRELRVASFEFVGPEGEVVSAPPDPGAISYSIALEGLTSQLREHHVTIDKLVVDAEGNEVYRQREPDNIRFPQHEAGATGGTLTGNFGVPGPGSYELELTITDVLASIEIEHRQAFTVEAPAAGDGEGKGKSKGKGKGK